MRTALILIQAALISLIAVIGASGGSDTPQGCPLPTAQAEQTCRF